MFINKLNQLYKPKRALFYAEISDDEISAYYDDKIPEVVGKYANSYGTYDYPGVFYVSKLERPVIGIEYRLDDERIEYPDDLQSVILDASFYYSVELDNERIITKESIEVLFAKMAEDGDAHRIYSDLSIKDSSDVIGVFTEYKKVRILYECRVDRDNARRVMYDDMDSMDMKMLYNLSFHDPITGHYNWNHLVSFLEMPLDKGIDDYAFVHFDVKEFKVINEVYGHIAANKVLINIARTMTEADFVYASARCHNDNFAMMIKDMPQKEMLSKLEDFFESLSHLEEDPNYRIYYRCGVVPMQRSVLMGNRVADAAKLAQALGKNPNKTEITVYTDKMYNDISWGNFIKAYLDTAIDNDEFVVYLQPKFEIIREEIKGAEALIRWNYRGKEFLSPGRFIPFFERDGSIGKIDDIVLKKVCAALAKWKEEGKKLYPISVNLSRERMYDEGLIDHLTEIVDSYGVSHNLVDFELTESATYDNMDHMISVLEELRNRGFKISMDDFGTGYSSLSLLTEMPLDTLKIDKSFVDKVGTDNERKEDIAVLRHIITLARELDFVCLAEGAENKSQVDRLGELGCDIIQGYYFSRPIPIEDYEKRYL